MACKKSAPKLANKMACGGKKFACGGKMTKKKSGCKKK